MKYLVLIIYVLLTSFRVLNCGIYVPIGDRYTDVRTCGEYLVDNVWKI